MARRLEHERTLGGSKEVVASVKLGYYKPEQEAAYQRWEKALLCHL